LLEVGFEYHAEIEGKSCFERGTMDYSKNQGIISYMLRVVMSPAQLPLFLSVLPT